MRLKMQLIADVKAAAKGAPAFGMQVDLWSKRRMRDAFVAVRLTFVSENTETSTRQYHDILLKFGHFPKLRHTAKAIAQWLLHALAAVGLKPSDITLAAPDGAANCLKAMKMMRVMYDVCQLHQHERCYKHATGEAGKDGGDNPECCALLRAFKEQAKKVLSSTQLQVGVRSLQLTAGIRKTEALVMFKTGDTRWGSTLALVERSTDMFSILQQLAQEERDIDPDMAAAVRADDTIYEMGIDPDASDVGEHDHVDISDADDDSGADDSGADDSADILNLSMGDSLVTYEQFRHGEIFEAIFKPAAVAQKILQAGKINPASQSLAILAKLRRFYLGSVFQVPRRTSNYKDTRRKEYGMIEVRRDELPPWAIKCCESMVAQLNAR
jgi:hypothetical protein